MPGDFQHVRIPDGITKDCVRGARNDFADGQRLALAAGNPDDFIRDLAVFGHDAAASIRSGGIPKCFIPAG
jgi:hypothetical protein